MRTKPHSAAQRVPQQTVREAQPGGRRACDPQPQCRVITLDYPVEWAGEVYSQLTARRLKAKDFRRIDQVGEGNAAAIAMAALVCGVDEAIIDELDATDYLKVQAVIADFFPSALIDKLSSMPSRS